MKKVLLTGAALMAFAAAGFAQNTTSYTGTGTTQTSTQNQTGNGLTSTVIQGNGALGDNVGNKSLTEQKSRNNTAAVTQNAAQYNQALIYQNTVNGPLSGPATNEATIQQVGSGSTALLPGDPSATPAPTSGVYGNVARIGQEQTDNKARIEQNGANNSTNYSNYGRIDQAGAMNGVSGTPTIITQNGVSQGNVGSINQSGNNNQNTFIDQSGNSIRNQAAISQSTDGNRASVTQDNNSVNNVGTVTQQNAGLYNGNNRASIQQNGTGSFASSGNTGIITQDIGVNIADIRQNAGGDGGSSNNNATINQTGYGSNTVDFYAINGMSYAPNTYVSQSNNSQANVATVNEGGSFNLAHVNQDNNSHDNNSLVNQSGPNANDYSLATVNQSNNSYRNDATVNQTGYNNEQGTINQTDNSHHNSGLIQQGGADDQATINQTVETANNKAMINQGGNNATSTNNQATVTQTYAYDPGNSSAPAGTGAGNNVTINQDMNAAGAGNKAVVLQGGNSGNITSSSKIVIDQDNSFNEAYLTQTGQSLTAGVKQTGNYNLLTRANGTDSALQLGSGYTLNVTQAVDGSVTASGTIRNIANVNSNNIGGGGITINQTLTNN